MLTFILDNIVWIVFLFASVFTLINSFLENRRIEQIKRYIETGIE